MFEFLKIMWIMRKIDEAYLTKQVIKGRITEQEKFEILVTKKASDTDS